jgi:hypothetical protein
LFEEGSQLLRDMALRMEPRSVGGKWRGTVMLTPLDVRTTRGPHFWEARAEVKADVGERARSLHSQRWTWDGKARDVHVYEAGLTFPDVCPVNLESPSHHEVFEVPFGRVSTGRVEISASQKDADRIGVAVSSDRYWFAIPFAPDRGSGDRAIHFKRLFTGDDESRAKVVLTNREYARRLCALNDLTDGRWRDSRHLVTQMVGLVGLILAVGVVGGIAGAYIMLRGDPAHVGYWGAATTALFVVGLASLGVSIYLLVTGNRSEPI